MEGAYINMKLIIGNRGPGIGNQQLFLVPYISNRRGYFKTVNSETGNREPGTSSLFWYILFWYITPMFQKCNSGTMNQFPVPF